MDRITKISLELEEAGLHWQPNVGDEICNRQDPTQVSILFDSCGLSLNELKNAYVWRPNVEQMVSQLEVRQAVLKHAGFKITPTQMAYIAVIQSMYGEIRGEAQSLRSAIGQGLKELLEYFGQQMH